MLGKKSRFFQELARSSLEEDRLPNSTSSSHYPLCFHFLILIVRQVGVFIELHTLKHEKGQRATHRRLSGKPSSAHDGQVQSSPRPSAFALALCGRRINQHHQIAPRTQSSNGTASCAKGLTCHYTSVIRSRWLPRLRVTGESGFLPFRHIFEAVFRGISFHNLGFPSVQQLHSHLKASCRSFAGARKKEE